MRTAFLSDVHANLEALDAVLEHASADRVIVLGDIVGYNANPAEVIARLGAAGAELLAGNHDMAASGRFDVSWFNTVAATAIAWTRERLGLQEIEKLSSLEPRGTSEGMLLVHGSVRDPAAEYVRDSAIAGASFAAEEFDVAFFGHTHLPIAYVRQDGDVDAIGVSDGAALQLRLGARYLLNPGSVGQPRDGDPRASYLVLEGDIVRWHRVGYDVSRTQRKVRKAGLPEVLADRLAIGR